MLQKYILWLGLIINGLSPLKRPWPNYSSMRLRVVAVDAWVRGRLDLSSSISPQPRLLLAILSARLKQCNILVGDWPRPGRGLLTSVAVVSAQKLWCGLSHFRVVESINVVMSPSRLSGCHMWLHISHGWYVICIYITELRRAVRGFCKWRCVLAALWLRVLLGQEMKCHTQRLHLAGDSPDRIQ